MAETYFILSPVITRSFDKNVHKRFLATYRLSVKWDRSGIPFHEYVQDLIARGQIEVSELEEFLNEELLYGNQRSISMYDLYGDYADIQNGQKILARIQKYYPYIDSFPYHNVLFQPFHDNIRELVSVRVKFGLDAVTVQKLIMIFSEKCTVSSKTGRHSEYSYITVEIDFTRNLLFVKTEPKTGVLEEDKRHANLTEKYFKIVKKMFQLQINEFADRHKAVLCNINTELYRQVYSKMVQAQPKKMEEYISTVTDDFLDKLEIKNYREKLAHNNIFHVKDFLTKMVEHILITNILYESAETGTLEDVEGYVTYIKFSDGTNISARIRGETYTEPIFSSEAFMALRASINNAERITILKIAWLNEFRGTRVSYDASDSQCLGIHLYKHHTKEEFDYAVNKYREIESRTFEEDSAVTAMEA
ncbi:MAG: hypothetical protein HFI70_15950 [Lachnospiraceae bacterium]|nr:hypothetical protein [Lachnospiraceae bacterium]